MGIYKACDIRGRYPDELDEATARDVGAAIGTELDGADCVVGGDVRGSTPALKDALIEGLTGAGTDVIDVGVCPTPALYWSARRLDTRGAAMVTASHNPPEYNGIKFMVGELPVSPDDMERIRRRVEERAFRTGTGRREERDIRTDYLDWLAGCFEGELEGLSVLVDAGN